MSKRKTFSPGQEVEVQRGVGGVWERMRYGRPSAARGHHVVDIPKTLEPMRMPLASGSARTVEVWHCTVPSVRIREVKP